MEFFGVKVCHGFANFAKFGKTAIISLPIVHQKMCRIVKINKEMRFIGFV